MTVKPMNNLRARPRGSGSLFREGEVRWERSSSTTYEFHDENPPRRKDDFETSLKGFFRDAGLCFLIGALGGKTHTYGVIWREAGEVSQADREAVASFVRLQPIRATADLSDLEGKTEATDFVRDIKEEVAAAMLVDTHAHLDDRRLRPQIADVLARARAEGVVQVVAIATTAEDSASVVDLASQHPGVFAAVGIHPNDAGEARPDDWDRIVDLAARPRVVAIGETGLDRHWDRTPFPIQQDYFARHLDLAHRLGRPVVIHCRESEADILEQLRSLGRPVSGVLHSFTGDWDLAQSFLDLGLHLSIAGMVTFANKTLDPLRDAASRVPLDRLLVETDSPYLTPHPFRGKLNEPARVALTAARVADCRAISLDDLARATTANARRLFGLPDADQIVSN